MLYLHEPLEESHKCNSQIKEYIIEKITEYQQSICFSHFCKLSTAAVALGSELRVAHYMALTTPFFADFYP